MIRPPHVAIAGFLLSMLLPPGTALAQSPVHTSRGDPSVRDDTIYALASDSTAYPESDVLTLLDDGIVRIEEDGSSSVTFRIVRQVLRRDAVEGLTEQELGYDAGHETFTLNWARVIDPESGIVTDTLLHMEELDVTVSRNSPIFTDRKRVRLSWGGVSAGRILDYSYTVRDTAPVLPGDFLRGWRVNSGTPIRRSRYVLDVPQGREVRVREQNLPGPTAERVEDGRRIREWSYAEVDRVEGEPFAADSNGVARRITTVGWLDWADISRWYAGLAGDRLEPSPEVEARLSELAPEGASPLETLKAAHKWVSQEIRYISLSLGMGGYQPRAHAEVLESLSGDCKDKAVLFVAMARSLGFEAYPVLIGTGAELLPEYPSIFQFNHMVAAVRLEDDWHVLDLTVPVAPFDHLYGGIEGRTGLLVKDDGSFEMLSLPESPPEQNRSSIEIEGSIQADGSFTGSYTETVTGRLQYRLRAEFARTLNTRQRESVGRNLASRTFPDARADSIELFDGRDLEATPRLWASVTARNVLRESSGGWILPLRIPRYGSRQAIDRLESDTLRSFPLDAEEVFGRRQHVTVLRLTLPEGWEAELPRDVIAESIFGRYEGTYAQDGRVLTVRRSLTGATGVYPPERVTDLLGWWEEMLTDDAEFIVVRDSGTSAHLPSDPR